MTSFDDAQHPRRLDGQFSVKSRAEPAVVLRAEPPALSIGAEVQHDYTCDDFDERTWTAPVEGPHAP